MSGIKLRYVEEYLCICILNFSHYAYFTKCVQSVYNIKGRIQIVALER